jgi:hypothetical protein
MRSYHREDLVQDISDLDVAKSESTALDSQNQVLHAQSKNLSVEHCIWLSAPLYHQMSCFVTIELGHSLEEIKKVGAVLSI